MTSRASRLHSQADDDLLSRRFSVMCVTIFEPLNVAWLHVRMRSKRKRVPVGSAIEVATAVQQLMTSTLKKTQEQERESKSM